MYTKDEIKALKQKWIKNEREYRKLRDSIMKEADKLSGNVTNELIEKDERNYKKFTDILRLKKEYHKACEDNLNEKLSQITDSLEKEIMEKRFREETDGIDDYDDIMDELGLW